ncbi:hypothetical protein Tco_0741328 [Tanacetum coccineum]
MQKERVAQEEASRVEIIEELDSIQAMTEADEQLTVRLQAKEQEQFSIEEKSRMLVEMIAKRKKFFATQRAAEQRKVVKSSKTRTKGSSKRVGDELESDKSKKQNIDENVEAEGDNDQEEEDMKRNIEIVKDDDVAIDAIPLATKTPMIVEYKINKDGRMGYFKLIKSLMERSKKDFVMLDSEDSTVTYTKVSSPFEDLSYIGSLGVDGLPLMLEDPYVEAGLQASPSPNYVSGPEHPPSPAYVPYVPEPVYPEFMPPEDDVLLAEEQPLPAAVSPTTESPGYIADFDPEEDEEDPEEDLADYPADGGDDDDDDESSDDDEDDDDVEEDEDEEEEEEEHLASTDFVPPPACRTIARMSIWDQTPIPFLHAAKVDRFLTISTPPPSPLTSYSSPLPHIPSPPLPVSSPLPVSPPLLPVSPTYPLGYRAAMIRLRAESPSTSYPLPLPSPIVLPHTRASLAMIRAAAPSTYILAPRLRILPSETPPSGTPPLLLIPLPTPLPPLILSSTDCRAGVSEVTLPPWKRLYIALGPRFKVGESSFTPTTRPTRGFRVDYRFVGTLDDEIRRDPKREVGYGITNTWDEIVEDMHETPAMTDVAGLSQWMTDSRLSDMILTRFIGDWTMHRMTASRIKNGGNGSFRVVFPLVRLVSSLQGFNSLGIHFLNFFNDPRIIREQRIAAYKGYRGGVAEVLRLWCELGGLGSRLKVLEVLDACHG